MADDDNVTDNMTVWNEDGTKAVTVTTDGAKERLDVTTNIEDDQKITINPTPGLPFTAFLENGGSSAMNVDGSVTPVEFTASPPSGKIWYGYSITVIIEDAAMNFQKYGGLTALTNGVDFKLKANNSAEFTAANLKRNGDYYGFVNELIIESSSTDLLAGKILLPLNYGAAHTLRESTSDYFKAVINDNLTGLDSHYVILRGYEIDA